MSNGVDFKAMALDLRAQLNACEQSKAELLEVLEGLLASFEEALIDEWSEPRESWGNGGTWHTDWHDNGLKAIAAISKARGVK